LALDLDVLVLTEFHAYIDNQIGRRVSVVEFLGNFPSYDHVYQYVAPHSFAIAILYKKNKLHHLKTTSQPLEENRLMLGAKFQSLESTESTPIWFFAVYLNDNYMLTKLNCELIPKYVLRDINDGDHYVVLGDFQFYPSSRGAQILKNLLSLTQWNDVCEEMSLTCSSFWKCHGSYIGYDHSVIDLTFLDLVDNKTAVRPDSIFLSHHITNLGSYVYVETLEQLMSKQTPSDHLPIYCLIEFS
jgi:hypothetical protein